MIPANSLFLGLDFGTSGARACVISPHGDIEEMARRDFGCDMSAADLHTARLWHETLLELLSSLPKGLRKHLGALAIDATSATVLACDAHFAPLAIPLLYNDTRATAEAAHIAQRAGTSHPAAMASSGLAKAMWLRQHTPKARFFMNQADWLSALLTGEAVSDLHNALKMGGIPGQKTAPAVWPGWLNECIAMTQLPRLVQPGSAIGLMPVALARTLGLSPDCLIRAGTTDSMAAFLATDAHRPGDAVTSLGSTLVLKVLSSQRVDAAEFGIYSHWFGDLWLTGGASNAGGSVLRQHFSDAELAALSPLIDPNQDTGLDYYPLPRPGERFPVNDPTMPPRLEPRPDNRAAFLHGLLEGLARIEARGYARLQELGAPAPSHITSMGGGAHNPVFTRLRSRLTHTPITPAPVQEACFGTARLAQRGENLFFREKT